VPTPFSPAAGDEGFSIIRPQQLYKTPAYLLFLCQALSLSLLFYITLQNVIEFKREQSLHKKKECLQSEEEGMKKRKKNWKGQS